jgi:hypothetical protein
MRYLDLATFVVLWGMLIVDRDCMNGCVCTGVDFGRQAAERGGG